MHAIRQSPVKYFISYTHILHIYSLVSIEKITRTLKVSVTTFYCCWSVLWHYYTNVIIFLDGKVFTHRMPYINTVQYYLWRICKDGKFIVSVTFLTFIYLEYYKGRNFIGIYQFTKLVWITAHNSWIQNKSKKYQRQMKGVVKTNTSHPPEINESKNSPDKKKGQVPKNMKYRSKKTRT